MRKTFKINKQKDYNFFASRLSQEKTRLPQGATSTLAALTYEDAARAFADLDLLSCEKHLNRLEGMRGHVNTL